MHAQKSPKLRARVTDIPTEDRPDSPADPPILSGNEEYAVQPLAAETGIDANQAWELIREHGLDRAALLKAARSIKAGRA